MGRIVECAGLAWMGLLLLVACGGRSSEEVADLQRGFAGFGAAAYGASSTILGQTTRSGLGGAQATSGSNASATGGTATGGVTSLVSCGDSLVVFGEECDDGNRNAGDGCSPSCRIELTLCPGEACVIRQVCGDGKLGPAEACDDSNDRSGDGCRSDCRNVEPGWICLVPGLACVPSCGDALVVGSETCDMGANNGRFSADSVLGCSRECREVPSCLLDGAPSPCPEICSGVSKPEFCPGICGNGVKDWNEHCDLGSENGATNYPSCTNTCQFGAYCGNGVAEDPEECDAGLENAIEYGVEGGCSRECRVSHYCGDGIVDSAFGEECDLGPSDGANTPRNSIDFGACATCRFLLSL